MAGGNNYYPTRDETIQYLKIYEEKYKLHVKRPVDVFNVDKIGSEFHLQTSDGLMVARAVVSATGSFRNPFIPPLKGADLFKGRIINSCDYRSTSEFKNERVAVAG